MQYRQQDSNGDYVVGQPFLVNSPDAVALAIRTRLALSLGEYFLDLSQGTPWWDGIMEKYQQNYDTLIKDRIVGTPGVTAITSYSSSISNFVPQSPALVNLIPDTDTFASWTNETGGVVSVIPGFLPYSPTQRSAAFVAYGTGEPMGYNFPASPIINVTPGQLYLFSATVDPTFVLDGYIIWAIYLPGEWDTGGLDGFGVGAGDPAAGYYINWLCPPGVTQVQIICDTDDATIQTGMPVYWSQPMLQVAQTVDVPNAYTPGPNTVNTGFTYTPNGRALNVSATVSTIYSGEQAIELSLPIVPAGVLYPNSALQNPPTPTDTYSLSYRQLDANGDYTVLQPFLSDSPDTVAQAVLTRLRLITGEYWLDLTQGMPWLNVIGQKVESAYYDPIIQQVILGTPGVTQITSYSSSVIGRALNVFAGIDTIFGSTVIASPVTMA